MNDLAGGVFEDVPTLLCGADGSKRINPLKKLMRPVWLTPSGGNLTLAAGGSANDTLTAPRGSSEGGDVEIHKLGAESTGRFAVKLYDQNLDVELMNSPVESSLIFGNGAMPSRLYESIWLPNTRSLKIEAFDLSGAGNTVKILAEGVQKIAQRTLEERARAQGKRFGHTYWLTFDSAAEITLGANGTATGVLTVPGGTHFDAWGLVHRSTGAFSMEFIEGSQRSLMYPTGEQDPDLVGAATGTVSGVNAASLPNVFATSWLMGPSEQIRVRLTDLTGAINKVSLAFPGRLLSHELGR